ncbi:MAG: AAA family ATPase, partial [Spirochaetales bacterium]|nr:AAA family ATPase [Spirochaetales bacterium]
PIKKYNTQSALNNFKEFTMLDPLYLSSFVGFTEDEVKPLCEKYSMDFNDIKAWYDGYSFDDNSSVYSPFSVVNALTNKKIKNYWIDTSSIDDAKDYINMNIDGLKEDVINMSLGQRVPVDVSSFDNDFVNLHNKDQVMTLLIHLGYLAYDAENKEAYVPNNEIKDHLIKAIKQSNWTMPQPQ